MLSLFRKKTDQSPLYATYRTIVAQSRQPVFYAEWGVPDTVTGRFDMISLHLCLLFRRLRNEQGPARRFAQDLFDLFFKDMDRSLREMGAGDLAVPKRIQKMGELFYGMLAALNPILDAQDNAALQGFLLRNVLPDGEGADPAALADHVLKTDAELREVPVDTILAGRFEPKRLDPKTV